MKASDIPTKFQVPFANAAASPDIRAIPLTTTDPAAASLQGGFPPETFVPIGAGGSPPDGRDFNGLFKQDTAWARWLSAGGPIKYDATFAVAVGGYPNGALLLSSAGTFFWLSTADDNETDPDGGSPANWTAFPTALISAQSAPAGTARSLIGSSAGSVTTAAWTVKEIIAKTALGGRAYTGASLVLTFDGSTTGANGMDTGTLPSSADVAVYAIYNPTTATWATLGTIACNGPVYTGADSPSGYTASALLAPLKTTGTNLVKFLQSGNLISIPIVSFDNLFNATITGFSIASAVPAAAVGVSGNLRIGTTFATNTNGTLRVGGEATLTVGRKHIDFQSFFTFGAPLDTVLLSLPQTLYYQTVVSVGTLQLATVEICGYTF